MERKFQGGSRHVSWGKRNWDMTERIRKDDRLYQLILPLCSPLLYFQKFCCGLMLPYWVESATVFTPN